MVLVSKVGAALLQSMPMGDYCVVVVMALSGMVGE